MIFLFKFQIVKILSSRSLLSFFLFVHTDLSNENALRLSVIYDKRSSNRKRHKSD